MIPLGVGLVGRSSSARLADDQDWLGFGLVGLEGTAADFGTLGPPASSD